jgi:hypothetical protein
MAKNYCGKNGCYDLFIDEGTEDLMLAIYLNSTRIYEIDDKGKYVQTLPPNRKTSDIDITFTNDDKALPYKIRIYHFPEDGLCRFVKELMNAQDELDTKDGIIDTVKMLLDTDHASWGKIPPEISKDMSH